MLKRKWKRGEPIRDPIEAAQVILDGGTLFDNHKPQNSGWMQNWSFRLLRARVRGGHIYRAIPIHPNEANQ